MIIEKVILNYLSNSISNVYVEEPKNPPTSYVLIDKTGSSRKNYINSSVIAIQSYAASKLKAAELNEAVKEAMYAITALNEICSCRLNSDYDYTDTTTKRYRYQAVFDIIHY